MNLNGAFSSGNSIGKTEKHAIRGPLGGEPPWGKRLGILMVPVWGWAAHGKTVRIRDACRGGGAYGKTVLMRPSSFAVSIFVAYPGNVLPVRNKYLSAYSN